MKTDIHSLVKHEKLQVHQKGEKFELLKKVSKSLTSKNEWPRQTDHPTWLPRLSLCTIITMPLNGRSRSMWLRKHKWSPYSLTHLVYSLYWATSTPSSPKDPLEGFFRDVIVLPDAFDSTRVFPDVLLEERYWDQKPRRPNLNRGRRLGRHAAVIPTAASIQVHTTTGTWLSEIFISKENSREIGHQKQYAQVISGPRSASRIIAWSRKTEKTKVLSNRCQYGL